MEIAIVLMGAAWWWHRPKGWRVPTYEESYPLDLKEVEETPENREAGVVVEDTPEGRVKMRREGGVFEYWAHRAMAYRYLEPVARKHVLLYGGTYAKLENATVKEVGDAKEGRSVFVTLKTTKRREVCKEINRYRWMGKETEDVTKMVARDVTFAAFKNKMNS